MVGELEVVGIAAATLMLGEPVIRALHLAEHVLIVGRFALCDQQRVFDALAVLADEEDAVGAHATSCSRTSATSRSVHSKHFSPLYRISSNLKPAPSKAFNPPSSTMSPTFTSVGLK